MLLPKAGGVHSIGSSRIPSQEAIRFSLRELGVPVVHWDGVQSLDLPLAGYTRRPLAARR